jgi:hypothetical protein
MTMLEERSGRVDSAEAQALFEEARRRRRRRWLISGVITLLIAVAAAAMIFSFGGSLRRSVPVPAPKEPSQQPAPPQGLVPHEQLQIRPVKGNSLGRCQATDIANTPLSTANVFLGFPDGAPASCLALGPAVLSVGSVRAVVLGQSEAGLTLVTVDLPPGAVASLQSRTAARPETHYAVVILGQVLSTPTGAQLAAVGSNGQFQIAGGLSPQDRRPAQIAQALRSPVQKTPAPRDLALG